MKTKTITLYDFDELSPQAQEKAREWYRECRTYDHDLAHVIEDAERILGLLGVELKYHDVPLMNGTTRREPNIWWQVGYVQSDGACFEGTYTYAAQAHTKIREEAPQDETLHRIADDLEELQQRYGEQLFAVVRHRHSGFFPEVETGTDDDREISPADVEETQELMRDLCTWIYTQLRTEDEYRDADEQVDEAIRANEYTFRENGKRED